MTKIALISDIHGNLLGLQAVIEDIEACRCDRIICLGDMVDGGNYNDEVVRFIRDNEIACVRGNHDEYKRPKTIKRCP
jgi:predicted phosphodiesterase